ncbi:MAG: hypothetical protein Q4E88_02335 [Coriobacteriia bacterium]|nr:hypothetical protein [Coriobacteriia bacterium]
MYRTKPLIKITSLLLSLFIVVSLTIGLTPIKSFANSGNCTKARQYNHKLDSFEVAAEIDRINLTDEKHNENHSYSHSDRSWDDCFGQPQDTSPDIHLMNVIHTYIDGTDYPFQYTVTGFYGDESGSWGRKANVQFFYNDESKVLRILCFGGGSEGFNTYNYHSGSTILEDEPEIEIGGWRFEKFHISQQVKKIEIDPKLQKIMKRSFQNMPYLESVDIIGQRYDKSNLNEIRSYAFRDCGKKNNNFYHAVKMNILKVKEHHSVDMDKDWAENTNREE